MRITSFLLLVGCLQVAATTSGQTVSLSVKEVSLREALEQIKKQSGYSILWEEPAIAKAKPVSVRLKNVSVETALTECLKGQPFTFRMLPELAIIQEKKETELPKLVPAVVEIKGRVLDDKGIPVPGVNVTIKGTPVATTTDANGEFSLSAQSAQITLILTSVQYEKKEVFVNTPEFLNITITKNVYELDQAVVIAYGTTTRRLNTGSVTKVSSRDIERQPVADPLAALAGQVPGMMVSQSSGSNGATFNIQIRGLNSITQGNEPLFIIDGIPYPNGFQPMAGVVTEAVNGGLSAFNNINPLDIESIEVLKDADATAIYGSRGSNGVVLVTTKKGKVSKTSFTANIYQGAGQVTRKMKLLNTQQYLEMRREAFANDQVAITAVNAPDLMLWDTTRYTDWQDYLIGGTANFTNANISLSGGNELTQFMFSGNYNRQGSVMPGDLYDNRGTGRLNVNHRSANKRFEFFMSSNYSHNTNRLRGGGSMPINLAPNYPTSLDELGNLVWEENGSTLSSNPVSYLKQKNEVVTATLMTNLNVRYEVLKRLYLKVAAGYNNIKFSQLSTSPLASLNPNGSNYVNSADFATTINDNWIIEPQIEYAAGLGKVKINMLVGTTLQNDVKKLHATEASGFPNDEVLEAISFAERIVGQTNKIEYRYQALFGRINMNYQNRYLLNLTARRDGSSRFGPDKRIANFGAVGAAWIFSEESPIKDMMPWLSFGKLRASYGITGNDQIGDYQYLDNYGAAGNIYQGQTGYHPSRLFNADYSWERNRKLETAMELAFLRDRIRLGVNRFSNRSDNQLINYALPAQTGFPTVLRNFGALVQNSGWEIMLSGNPVQRQDFTWTVSANVTFQQNKLLEFPGLESSSYANDLVIGQPLRISKLLQWTGVDPSTGIYTFDGTARPADQTVIANLTPKFFGGLSNHLSYKNFEFSFLFHFVKQDGINYLSELGSYTPGTAYNQPIEVFENRWRKQGDQTYIQRFATTGAANTAHNNYSSYSNARVSDASFIRLKNAALYYTLPQSLVQKAGGQTLLCYVQGQNLFTITRYKGLDPETAFANSLPPLSVLSFGLQFTL